MHLGFKPKRLSPLNYIVRWKVERKTSIARIEIYFNCMTLVACDNISFQECTKFTRIWLKFITFYSAKNIQLYISLRIKTLLFIFHQISILFHNVQQHFNLHVSKSNRMIHLGKNKQSSIKIFSRKRTKDKGSLNIDLFCKRSLLIWQDDFVCWSQWYLDTAIIFYL